LVEIQQRIVYPDDVSWLGQKIHAKKKNTQTLSVLVERIKGRM